MQPNKHTWTSWPPQSQSTRVIHNTNKKLLGAVDTLYVLNSHKHVWNHSKETTEEVDDRMYTPSLTDNQQKG